MKFIKEHIRQITSILLVVGLVVLSVLNRKNLFDAADIWYLWVIIEVLLLASIIVISFIPVKKNKIFTYIMFFITPLITECCVELLNGNMLWDIDMFGNVLMNYFINLLLYLIIFALSGSTILSIRFISIFLEVFGIANYFVKEYKGGPLLPWDIGSIATAGKVAHGYSYTITKEIIVSVTLIILIWKLSSFCIKNPKTKLNRIFRGISLGLFTVFVSIFYFADFFQETFGATPDFFNQTRGYEAKGAIAEFLVNTKYMHLSEPDDYDTDTLEENILSSTDDNAPTILETALQNEGYTDEEIQEMTKSESVDNPNIIVIMNESFSDLAVIGDFDTNEDYMPFINSLKDAENCISGYSYVSTIGTGTSNTEYEFLTGNSMAFLPIGSNAYQLYVTHPTPTLVSSLKEEDYVADAFHPYYKDNWNRKSVYENFGFDEYTGYGDYSDFEKLRLYVSDSNDFKHVEQLYEERDTSKPYFLFNVTMQNHSSYDQTDNDWFQQINLENMDGMYTQAEQYLSLIKETDDAFADLLSYFSTVDEPTIVLMFGDHQPYIENEFYEEVMGKELNDLTDEENQKRYITRFVLWANYDIPEGWIDQISVNYLSTLLSQISGSELTEYQQYLNTLYTKMPVITMMGCKDWDGNYFKVDEDNPYSLLLNYYAQACYNNLIDEKKRINSLFYLKS